MQSLKAWIIDTVFAIRGFIQMYLYRIPPKKYLEHDTDKNSPILIIQGYMDRWGFLKNLADRISNSGYQVFVLPQLKNNLKDISASAYLVKNFIEKNELKNVIIVGHSKGGLIGKYLLVNKNEDRKIIGLVTISTPYLGSDLASYFKFLKSNQFDPDNRVLEKLWSHHEVNKKIIAIYPKTDNVVWAKSYLDGALDNIYLDVLGHHRILFDTKAQKRIILSISRFT